ncbi:MAG: glycosyltransferase family 61 protein [Nocardioides sp.]
MSAPPAQVSQTLADLPGGPVLVLVERGIAVPGWLTSGSLAGRVRPVVGRRRERRLSRRLKPAAIIDLRTATPASLALLWALRARGAYVAAPGTVGLAPGLRRAHRPRRPSRERLRELRRATRLVEEVDGWLVARKRVPHLLQLTRDDVARTLSARAHDLAVTTLATLPAGRFASGRVRMHGEGPDLGVDAEIGHPELAVHRYDGPVDLLGGGALVVAGGCVLPESFRWYDARPLEHFRLADVGGGFARLKRRSRPAQRLVGSYFFFDYSNAGHYGHLLTEAVPRLWAWDLAKQDDPSLKILLRAREHDVNRPMGRPDPELLEAFGIAPDDIAWFHGAARVDALVGAPAMWHNAPPYHAHPRLVETWDRIRTGLIGDRRGQHARIFVTRSAGGRPCRNTPEVEHLFAAHGFTVVDPGELSRADQALVFAGAEVVAGFGGTGMFNLAFAPDVRHVMLLNHAAYQARNEHLFAAVRGADLDYFWSEPDIVGESYEAHQSGWEFDLARHEQALVRLLEGGRA